MDSHFAENQGQQRMRYVHSKRNTSKNAGFDNLPKILYLLPDEQEGQTQFV